MICRSAKSVRNPRFKARLPFQIGVQFDRMELSAGIRIQALIAAPTSR